MYFCCKSCKIPISKTVFRLEDKSLLCIDDGKDYLPQGFYFLEDNEEFPLDFGKYILNLKDLINVRHHGDSSRLNGCCGLDGLDGINAVCENNHEIGIECSDCWMPHSMGFAAENVELINND